MIKKVQCIAGPKTGKIIETVFTIYLVDFVRVSCSTNDHVATGLLFAIRHPQSTPACAAFSAVATSDDVQW